MFLTSIIIVQSHYENTSTMFIFVQFSVFAITPPKGFTPLFNGKNLDGWWGLKTEDPEKWLNLPKDKFQEKWEASQVDIRKHWRVENGILINDGKGLFLSTEKNYQDFELLLEYRQLRSDSGLPAGRSSSANLGHHKRRWKMETWCG